MTNLILGIIAFAGVVCAAWLSARENNRLKEQLDELQDENDNTLGEFLTIRIYAVALILACGWPLCRLTKKWECEGKIKI